MIPLQLFWKKNKREIENVSIVQIFSHLSAKIFSRFLVGTRMQERWSSCLLGTRKQSLNNNNCLYRYNLFVIYLNTLPAGLVWFGFFV